MPPGKRDEVRHPVLHSLPGRGWFPRATPSRQPPCEEDVNNPNILPVPIRDRLMMAYALCEWATALTHLSALRQVGCRVSDDLMVQIGTELSAFADLWATTHMKEWTTVEAVDSAQKWLAVHTEELDELLKEMEDTGVREEV